jgi:excisionase family DNA binding protein
MKGEIFTTHDIARILSLDITTVIDWIDQEKLTGYKTLGGHRRVKKSDLVFFLQEHKMPIPTQLTRTQKLILLVEDDADFRLAIRGFIKEIALDASLHEAENGFLAGKMVEEHKPDLVILDVFLPGINGFDVCKYIRRDPALAETKILAMSGQPGEETQREIMDSGADAFLRKPFGLADFQKSIEKMIGHEEIHTAKR